MVRDGASIARETNPRATKKARTNDNGENSVSRSTDIPIVYGGRNGKNHLEGNQLFRKMMDDRREEFLSADREGRRQIVEECQKHFRFVDSDGNDLDEAVARSKIGTNLIDNRYVWRNKMPSNPTDPPTEDNADKAEKLGLQESFSALLVQGHVLNRDEHAAHVVELLKDTDAVKGFIIAGGNRDAVALIQENDSFLVQTCGWNLLASNLKNNIFPNHLAERALVDLGVCRLMTSSLLTCTNLDYFADLMSIFRCIFGKSDVLMDKFVSTDGAVVALLTNAARRIR